MARLDIDEDWGSTRLITALTPDSFHHKILVVSTLLSPKKDDSETAVAQVESTNFLTIDYRGLDWNVLKRHNSYEEAVEYHFEKVEELSPEDCERIQR